MKPREFIPSLLCPLEERIALSHSALGQVLARQPAFVEAQTVGLRGIAIGSDKTVGTVHHFRATGGTISPLGTVSLTGYLVIPKTVGADRPVRGSVTILSAHGSVTVALHGTVTVYRGSFRFASGNLTYKITSGTKAYHGVAGSGAVLYGPGPVFLSGRFLLDFGNVPPPP